MYRAKKKDKESHARSSAQRSWGALSKYELGLFLGVSEQLERGGDVSARKTLTGAAGVDLSHCKPFQKLDEIDFDSFASRRMCVHVLQEALLLQPQMARRLAPSGVLLDVEDLGSDFDIGATSDLIVDSLLESLQQHSGVAAMAQTPNAAGETAGSSDGGGSRLSAPTALVGLQARQTTRRQQRQRRQLERERRTLHFNIMVCEHVLQHAEESVHMMSRLTLTQRKKLLFTQSRDGLLGEETDFLQEAAVLDKQMALRSARHVRKSLQAAQRREEQEEWLLLQRDWGEDDKAGDASTVHSQQHSGGKEEFAEDTLRSVPSLHWQQQSGGNLDGGGVVSKATFMALMAVLRSAAHGTGGGGGGGGGRRGESNDIVRGKCRWWRSLQRVWRHGHPKVYSIVNMPNGFDLKLVKALVYTVTIASVLILLLAPADQAVLNKMREIELGMNPTNSDTLKDDLRDIACYHSKYENWGGQLWRVHNDLLLPMLVSVVSVLEVLLQIAAVGAQAYVSTPWNVFDLGAVCLQFVSCFVVVRAYNSRTFCIAMLTSWVELTSQDLLVAAQIAQIARLLRLMGAFRSLDAVVEVLYSVRLLVMRLLALLLCCLVTYGAVGMWMFCRHSAEWAAALQLIDDRMPTEWFNWDHPTGSTLCLLVVMVGNNWNDLAAAGMVATGTKHVYAFFGSFFLFTNSLALSVLTAVIFDSFKAQTERDAQREIQQTIEQVQKDGAMPKPATGTLSKNMPVVAAPSTAPSLIDSEKHGKFNLETVEQLRESASGWLDSALSVVGSPRPSGSNASPELLSSSSRSSHDEWSTGWASPTQEVKRSASSNSSGGGWVSASPKSSGGQQNNFGGDLFGGKTFPVGRIDFTQSGNFTVGMHVDGAMGGETEGGSHALTGRCREAGAWAARARQSAVQHVARALDCRTKPAVWQGARADPVDEDEILDQMQRRQTTDFDNLRSFGSRNCLVNRKEKTVLVAGDVVEVVKAGSQNGLVARVVLPDWAGKLKVQMVSGPHAGRIRSYECDDVRLHELELEPEREQELQASQPPPSMHELGLELAAMSDAQVRALCGQLLASGGTGEALASDRLSFPLPQERPSSQGSVSKPKGVGGSSLKSVGGVGGSSQQPQGRDGGSSLARSVSEQLEAKRAQLQKARSVRQQFRSQRNMLRFSLN
jgi:hypothetical protein